MTKPAFTYRVQNRRLICALLAVMCLCTSGLVHSHSCLEESGTLHFHRCTNDCCTVCAFRSLIICALLFVSSRVAVRRLIGYRIERRGASPEASEETLVQLKVKLSN